MQLLSPKNRKSCRFELMVAAPKPADLNVPLHVAIIMDGNGRWAKARGMPRIVGHRNGANAVRRAVEAAGDLGISYLTLFGFSSENWNRPEQEVGDLMRLLKYYLQSETAELNEKGIRLRIIGDRGRFSKDTIELIDHAETLTAGNTKLTLVLALSYGGRQEIVSAAQALARAAKDGEIDPSAIDENLFSQNLLTRDIPDPDLLIRTSGELRISNFLLWQIAYTELVFIDTYWPDFQAEHLHDAVREFSNRERRYGLATGPV